MEAGPWGSGFDMRRRKNHASPPRQRLINSWVPSVPHREAKVEVQRQEGALTASSTSPSLAGQHAEYLSLRSRGCLVRAVVFMCACWEVREGQEEGLLHMCVHMCGQDLLLPPTCTTASKDRTLCLWSTLGAPNHMGKGGGGHHHRVHSLAPTCVHWVACRSVALPSFVLS